MDDLRRDTKHSSSLWTFVSLRGTVFLHACCVALFALALAACGGPGPDIPTAVPADVTVPDQPAPVYADDAQRFTLATPMPPVFRNAGDTLGSTVSAGRTSRPAVAPVYQQTPSALGIVRGGAALRSAPGGPQIGSMLAGTTVTITGKSVGGLSYAVFDSDGRAGWLSAGTVTVYGGDDLVVVDTAPGPGPIATLIADSMVPVEPSVLEGVGRE
jgi:predicted small lipoprotein YifL